LFRDHCLVAAPIKGPDTFSRPVVAGPLVMSPGKGARRVGWGWSRRCVRVAGRASRRPRIPEKDSRPLFLLPFLAARCRFPAGCSC